MDEVIRVEGLTKNFGSLRVLRGIDCTVSASEVVCVIGPSGSGKSTFLRCLNGLEEASGGRVLVHGISVHDNGTDIDALRSEIGMVFQRFNLFPHKTVLVNVMLAQVLVRKKSKDASEKLAKEIIERVGLSDKLDVYPSKLSGGQQQRVAIARALAMEPEIMLFDEPTSALDPELVGEVLGVMKDLARSGMTMLVVTHEMEFARKVGTRLLFIDQGKISEDGPPNELLSNPPSQRLRDFLQHVS